MSVSSASKNNPSRHVEAPEPPGLASRQSLIIALGAGGLILVTLLAYIPALRGEFVWDDDSWTTRILPLLRDISGLWAMWGDITALQQYFPLSGTTFWLDYHLWGFWTLPYHVENVLLHALAAVLAWRLLKRLRFSGAWLAAAIFAWHPMMVESAAWITERKNVLSLSLYLGSLLAYGKFTGFWGSEGGKQDETPSAPGKEKTSATPKLVVKASWGAYGLALLLFFGAMLAKTTAFSLPPVLLLLAWWKRGRLRWRGEILPTLPFFAMAIGLGCITSWVERHHVGTGGPEWAISFPARWLIAGRALWFYSYKLVWPANLCFVYPRWHLNPGSVGQWMFPLAAVVAVVALWLARKRIGRGPLTAVLFFVGTLSPLLGFINGYFMRYSFVCDHWAYLSSLGLITLGVGILTSAATRFDAPRLLPISAAVVLPILLVLTWEQSKTYRDMETLWRTTIARNPGATMAEVNLGNLLYQQRRPTEAVVHFEKALNLDPGSADAHSNLGAALLDLGRVDDAIAHLRRAIEIQPTAANAHNNLGNALLQAGHADEALGEFEKAVALAPGVVGAHYNLGRALLLNGRAHEAIPLLQRELELQPDRAEVYATLGQALLQERRFDDALVPLQKAIALQPTVAGAHYNLGNALLQKNRSDEAALQFQTAIQLDPTMAAAHIGLGNAALRKGFLAQADTEFQQAVALRPNLAEAHFNLAGLRLQQGKTEEALKEYEQTLANDPNFAAARNNLGTVLLSLGRLDEAIAQFHRAMRSNPRLAEAHNNLANAYFQKGLPKEAVAEYEAALASQQGNPQLLNNLAWALATCPEGSVRNGSRAVQLAQAADQLVGHNNPQILGTLAAAWAEVGQFPEAIAAAQRAVELAAAQTNTVQAEALRARLTLYQANTPFRDLELKSR